MFRFIISFFIFFFFSFSSFASSYLSIHILHSSDLSKLTPFLGKSFFVVPDKMYVHSTFIGYDFEFYVYSRLKFDNGSVYFGSFINEYDGGIVINTNPLYPATLDSSGHISLNGALSDDVYLSAGYLSLDGSNLIFHSYPSSSFSSYCQNNDCHSCSDSDSGSGSTVTTAPFSYNYVTPPGLSHPSGVPAYCYLSCPETAAGYNDYLHHYPFGYCDNLSKAPCFLYDKDTNGFNTDCVDGHTRDYYCFYDDNSNFIDCSFGIVEGNVYNYSSPRALYRSFLSNPSPFQEDSAGSVVVPTPYLTLGSAEDYNGCSIARVYYHLDIDFSPSNPAPAPSACLLNPTPPAPSSLIINNFVSDNHSISVFNAFSESNNRKILNSLNKLNNMLNPSSGSLPSHNPLSSGDFDTSIPFVVSDNTSSFFLNFISNSPFSFSGSSLHLSDSFCSFSGSLFGSSLSISFCNPHIISFLNILGSFLVLFSVFLFFFISFR